MERSYALTKNCSFCKQPFNANSQEELVDWCSEDCYYKERGWTPIENIVTMTREGEVVENIYKLEFFENGIVIVNDEIPVSKLYNISGQ